MEILALFSFMLNLCKCRFLVGGAAVLGFELCRRRYVLRQKYKEPWILVWLLTLLKELQQLLGKLLYALSHIAQFGILVSPIEDLLIKPVRVAKRSAECTVALNEFLVHIFAWVRLVQPDPMGIIVIYPLVEGNAYFIALIQQGPHIKNALQLLWPDT